MPILSIKDEIYRWENFIILSLIGTIVGGGWTGYKFH